MKRLCILYWTREALCRSYYKNSLELRRNPPLVFMPSCVFEKAHYAHFVTPHLRMLKFSTFGHDMVVLHEQDIRKKLGAFSKLSKEPREAFLDALSTLMAQCNFTIIPIVIDKYAIKTHGLDPIHVYHLAMRLGLETLHQLM